MIICNQEKAASFCLKNKDYWHVIFITSPDELDNWPLVKHYAKSALLLEFHDITDKHKDFGIRPEREHIMAAITFAKGVGQERLIVCCQAGVSRSSATGYIITSLDKDPSEAIKVLDRMLHWPNRKVVELGAELLSNPNILSEFEKWIGSQRLS